MYVLHMLVQAMIGSLVLHLNNIYTLRVQFYQHYPL